MATKLTDYIKTYDNILDESVCKSIIESFSKSDSVYVDREQRPSFRELNISKKYEDKDPLWIDHQETCLLYTSPSPRDLSTSRMPSSA